MAGDTDRHEEAASSARRVGRGAAAAIGGATLSLPVAASAWAMPVCACGGGHPPPPPDAKPTPPKPRNLSVEEAIKKESAPPPPTQPAPPPAAVHPSPDAVDAQQKARTMRELSRRNVQQQPKPDPKPEPVKIPPRLPVEDQIAIQRERKAAAPPPPPRLAVEDQKAVREEKRVPSIVEKHPPAKPPMPGLFSLTDPLSALRGQPAKPHESYPAKGPALADAPHDDIGLPFAGSVETEIGCGYSTSAGGKCLHLPNGKESKPGPSASVELIHTEVKTRGDEELGEDGRKVSLEVSGDWKLSEKVGIETKKQVEVELEHSVAKSVSYEATIDPRRAEAISDGDATPPNPIDPESLEKGDGLVFAHERTEGGSEKVGYKLVSMKSSHETGTRESTGVTRVNHKTVRVYVGNEDLIRQALTLGIGIDELGASIGNSIELDDGKVRQVDIDTSTDEGQKAYRRFIGSGRLPDAKTEGVTDSAVADTGRWSSSSTFSVHVGPMKIGGTSQGSRGVVTEIRHDDGTVERSFTTDEGDVGAINKRIDKVGSPTKTSYTLLLQNVNEGWVNGYRQLHGEDTEVDGNRDLRVDFTDRELTAMRDQAVDQLVAYTERVGEGLTREEVEQRLEDHEPVMAMGVETEMVAGAKTPEQVLGALDLIARGNSTEAVEFLEQFTMATARARTEPPNALGQLKVMNPAR